MRVVFMGTPSLAAAVLEQLVTKNQVVGVFTRADAVRGRGKTPEMSPVKVVATGLGVPVFEPRSLRDPQALHDLESLEPDVICVAAYGKILPEAVLAVPRHGCLNVHASLLPRWRGAAPIERAILAGDERTGVSIMRMEQGLDTGAYCLQGSIAVGHRDAEQLTDDLARLGGSLLLDALDALADGTLRWVEQDEASVTYAEKIGKGELNPSPSDPKALIDRKVRAAGPSHPARAVVAGRPVTILRAGLPDDSLPVASRDIEPGEVRLLAKRLLLGCADGAIELLAVKPDGKKEQDAVSFAAGVQNLKRDGSRWEQEAQDHGL